MFTILIVAVLLMLCIASWQSHLRAKEQALAAAKQHCAERDWQLLDDTVVLKKWRLTRDGGRLTWLRHYHFNFCHLHDAPEEARIVLIGRRILGISSLKPKSSGPAEVISLNHYRQAANKD